MYIPLLEQLKSLSKKLHAIIIVTLAATLCSVAQADEKRLSSPAQHPGIQYDGSNLKRKDFNFFGFKAWLKQGGEWSIEGTVSHKGLLCGTYEVGMRFGVANEGCTDVEWITTDQYVTSQVQCNNATMTLHGVNVDPVLASHFDKITCAERIVRCTGNCK